MSYYSICCGETTDEDALRGYPLCKKCGKICERVPVTITEESKKKLLDAGITEEQIRETFKRLGRVQSS